MSVSYEDLLKAVTSDPENDDARLAFAASRRAQDPEHALFIELQVSAAKLRREQRKFRDPVQHNEAQTRDGTIIVAREHWAPARTIAKYTKRYEYDRGFITKIDIDPHLFLEYGSWLLTNAPIRQVGFGRPMDDSPFPIDELAGSPLLDRLDSLGFSNCDMTDQTVARLAASPHLSRLLHLDLSWNDLGPGTYEALAAAPATRKILALVLLGDAGRAFPGQRLEQVDQAFNGASIFDWFDLLPAGRELERRYGYIPWLHAREHGKDGFDVAWYVANGILPAKPVGSVVEP